MRGDVALARIGQNVLARGVAAVAHQRSGGEPFGLRGCVTVVNREDVAGLEASRDPLHPSQGAEVDLGAGAAGRAGQVAVEIVADLSCHRWTVHPNEALAAPADERLARLPF